MLVDLAVAVADGATTMSDVAVLPDQAALFGPVASDSTCWRLLDQLDAARLGAVASARAEALEVVWAQRAELLGVPFPAARAAGRELPGLVIDLDASIVVCHRPGILRGHVQEDVRLSPVAGVLRQHRRVPGRAAEGQRRLEHRG